MSETPTKPDLAIELAGEILGYLIQRQPEAFGYISGAQYGIADKIRDRIAALEAENAKLRRDLEEAYGQADPGNRVKFAEAEMRRAERERDGLFVENGALSNIVQQTTAYVALLKREVHLCRVENATLRAKLTESEAYADKLAAGLPMLPADIENLRNANFEFAKENDELRAQVAGLAKAVERVLKTSGGDRLEAVEAAMAGLEPALARCAEPAALSDDTLCRCGIRLGLHRRGDLLCPRQPLRYDDKHWSGSDTFQPAGGNSASEP